MARISCCGTSRDRCVAAPSAPRSTSGRPKVASCAAITMSALPARPTPPPRQNPCTAAITGTAQSYTAANAANRGCFAAFAAVYDCAVPVIAAVQGFCLGGGVGLAGNADIVIAAQDATFGLPEVDRGALGAATHLS